MTDEIKLTQGDWHVRTGSSNGKDFNEICWSADGECVAEVVHELHDAIVMAKSKEMLAMLIYFIQKDMLSSAGDELARGLIASIHNQVIAQ